MIREGNLYFQKEVRQEFLDLDKIRGGGKGEVLLQEVNDQFSRKRS